MREIARLETLVAELAPEAAAAASLRVELAATRGQLDELRAKTLQQQDEGAMRAEVTIFRCS